MTLGLDPLPQSRGGRLLCRSWHAWVTPPILAVAIGVLAVVPPWQGLWIPAKVLLLAYGAFVIVSLMLLGRTWLAITGEALVVQGRLRRTTIDLATVRRFVAEEQAPGDLWGWLTLPYPSASPPISGLRVDLRDGSEQVIGSVLGSIGGCSALAVELNRRMREARGARWA